MGPSLAIQFQLRVFRVIAFRCPVAPFLSYILGEGFPFALNQPEKDTLFPMPAGHLSPPKRVKYTPILSWILRIPSKPHHLSRSLFFWGHFTWSPLAPSFDHQRLQVIGLREHPVADFDMQANCEMNGPSVICRGSTFLATCPLGSMRSRKPWLKPLLVATYVGEWN